jgi:hypothetical protein
MKKPKDPQNAVIRTPFGMKAFHIGSVSVYTLKIRFSRPTFQKVVVNIPPSVIKSVSDDGKYVTLTYESADYAHAREVYKQVGIICREVAFANLHKKYEWLTNKAGWPEHSVKASEGIDPLLCQRL